MTNPLLTPFSLPPFSKIRPEHVVPAVTQALDNCRAAVESVVAQGAPYTWENLCQPLAEVDDVLGRLFSPVSHLNSVKNSPELREAYEQTLPLLSEYSTWLVNTRGCTKPIATCAMATTMPNSIPRRKNRSITLCVISNSPALVCRKRNRPVTVKLRPVCLSWATSTATTCWTRPWAG